MIRSESRENQFLRREGMKIKSVKNTFFSSSYSKNEAFSFCVYQFNP